MSKPKIAMQTRCLKCLREQYMPAVSLISTWERPCVWCNRTSSVMSQESYREALIKRREEMSSIVLSKK